MTGQSNSKIKYCALKYISDISAENLDDVFFPFHIDFF